MAVYSASNLLAGTQQAIASASTYKSQVLLTGAASTPTRALITEFDVGSVGTPADTYYEWDVSRCTTLGTGTTATPNPMDSTLRACSTVATVNCTVEPAVTGASSVFYLALNQRASYRWVAAPGSEIIVPATSTNGFDLRARGSGTTTVSCMALFTE